MHRLDAHNFPFLHRHLVLEGGHAEPTRHFDVIISFLEANFPVAPVPANK